jgi:hypothetical protein
MLEAPTTTEAIVSEAGTGDIEQRLARLEQRDERLTRALERLAEARAPAPRRNWDAYAAVIASFVGLLALAVSAYTAQVQRQQLRAQIWPHVAIWESDTSPGLYLTNHGTGPARVIAARVTVDGAPVKSWTDLRKAAGFTDDETLTTSSVKNVVLPPGKDYAIWRPGDNDPSRESFRRLVYQHKHTFTVTICYCSILEECWTTGFGAVVTDGPPRSPEACPIPAAERFAQ